MLVGGILLPLARRYRPHWLPARFDLIYPPSYLWVVASCALLCKLEDKFIESLGFRGFVRVSEVIELYLYWFIMLYLFHMLRVVRGLRDKS